MADTTKNISWTPLLEIIPPVTCDDMPSTDVYLVDTRSTYPTSWACILQLDDPFDYVCWELIIIIMLLYILTALCVVRLAQILYRGWLYARLRIARRRGAGEEEWQRLLDGDWGRETYCGYCMHLSGGGRMLEWGQLR